MAKTTEDLRRIADLIDGYPKYIRRDCGSLGVEGSIRLLLEPYGLSDNQELIAAIDKWSEDLFDTQRKYYKGQFKDAA